eukprot:m.176803 g.176803  ORF g.176803 m.176803 type:complete len:685 (-) comp24460_c0_seq1:2944-4998(-)
MLLATLLVVVGVVGATASSSSQPPNIIMMVVDDLGWNDVGWRDGFKQIKTPKLDKMVAEESMILSNYYVYRFCSPTRSTFMTGRYPWHIGQQTQMNLNPTPGIACGINLKYDFLPKMLKQKGYATWALGKWHLGFLTDQYTPTYRGFDSYLGYYSGAEEHFTHEKSGLGMTAYDLANNSGTSINSCLWAVGNASSFYSSYLYGNETLRMLDAHDETIPLFVYLAWNNVHSPCEAPDNYLEVNSEIKDKSRQGLAGMMSAIDDQLTAVVDGIKAKGSMWDNTFLVFTTDNGGNLGGSGCNYPLRGGKYTFWQGGVRGQAFVSGGLLPPAMRGSQWHGAAHAADWYTTFAAMAGATVANTGPLAADGVALYDAIITNASSPRAEVVIQIMSNSSDNKFEAPSPEWCTSATSGDVALCEPPQNPTPPRRPYPVLGACNASDPAQLFTVQDGLICQANDNTACFNVQKSEDHIILYAPSKGNQNSEFSMTGGLVQGALRKNCVLAEGPASQLLFGACTGPEAVGWSYNSANQSIQHGGQCVVAVPVPSGPPSPVGLELGVLIQGKYKLIMGYPGWKAGWDGWILPSNVSARSGDGKYQQAGNNTNFCEPAPCLFDIFADPTEHTDIAALHPDVVSTMSARILELLKSEVTVKESNLCPTPLGSKSDERSAASAKALGFWVPWLPPIAE